MLRIMKRRIFTFFMIGMIFLIFFIIAEVSSRMIIGKRLIVQVEEDGLYHFKPNQEGWYSHRLRTPHAKINDVGARGENIDI